MEEDRVGLEITTELRLGLPSHSSVGCEAEKLERKRVLDEVSSESATKVQRKGEVVGWPPVCSYRKKKSAGGAILETSKNFVKVSMDGAPFLRKIDLGTHEGYSGLAFALDKLFGCYGIGEALRDGESGEYVQIYEDKDGDWMLVGDVPWQMFRESCKRLRIMKRLEAKFFGVQPVGGAEIIK